MRIIIPNRRLSALSGLGILLLAIAVFGWGIKYKLSLYDAPGSFSTHIAQAKLLSQRERPVTARTADSAHVSTPPFHLSSFHPTILATAIIFDLHLVVALRYATMAVASSRQQRCANSSFFSFRPPPISA